VLQNTDFTDTDELLIQLTLLHLVTQAACFYFSEFVLELQVGFLCHLNICTNVHTYAYQRYTLEGLCLV